MNWPPFLQDFSIGRPCGISLTAEACNRRGSRAAQALTRSTRSEREPQAPLKHKPSLPQGGSSDTVDGAGRDDGQSPMHTKSVPREQGKQTRCAVSEGHGVAVCAAVCADRASREGRILLPTLGDGLTTLWLLPTLQI